MGLDLRLPIGIYFTLLGVMLEVYGFLTASNTELYKHSLDLNINIIWGAVLLVFGLLMLIPALIARKNNAGK